MPKKPEEQPSEKQPPQGIAESANQIWLAGLAAFEKAQSEGTKFFEALVKEGEAVEARSKKLAAESIETAKSRVQEAQSRAFGRVDKLEQVFQDRVYRSLRSLGIPTHEDLDKLAEEVAELRKIVDTLVAAKKDQSK